MPSYFLGGNVGAATEKLSTHHGHLGPRTGSVAEPLADVNSHHVDISTLSLLPYTNFPLPHISIMLRLFARSIPYIRISPAPKPSYIIIRNMGSGRADTEQLKASKLFDVSHVTALVTGGGTGIGLMITQALVANGAKVYITSRRGEVLETTAHKHEAGPGKIIP